MTKRSIILGILSAIFVCAFCFFNDWVLRQTYLVGNNMPAAIYGVLILTAILINPLLKRWHLTGRELAVIMALTVAGASIPGGGLVRTLIPTLVTPFHIEKTSPAWKKMHILSEVPAHMLVEHGDGVDDDLIVNGYIQGLGKGVNHITLKDIPWKAWQTPLLYWCGVAMTLWTALTGLMLVMHRQWSTHEHLPYPIANFTTTLFPQEGRLLPEICHSKLFWVATVIVLAIHLNNYACVWFPNQLVRVTTELDFSPFGTLFTTLTRGGGSFLLRPHIYLIVIGMVYFVPGDIVFSLGIGPFLWCLLVGFFAAYGIRLDSPIEGSNYFSLNPRSFFLFGANVGVFSVMLYTGRHYYLQACKSALFLAPPPAGDRNASRGFRLFLIFGIAFYVLLIGAGIDPVLSLPYFLFMGIGFIVLARVIAETGQIYLKSYFWPCSTLWGLLGVQVVGAHQMLLMMLMTNVLFIDPRESLTPFLVNALKVLETSKVKLGKTTAIWLVTLVIGLLVAIPVTLYIKYDMGSGTGDPWSTIIVPKGPFDNAVAMQRKLLSQGLPTHESGSFLQRLGKIAPQPLCTAMALIGIAAVLLFTLARLRFTWWPFHPLMFVTWSATPLRYMCFSYLIGWLIKSFITRFGGSKAYNKLKPIMLGLIAGEVLGALFPTIFGLFFYLTTGQQPRGFNVIPG